MPWSASLHKLRNVLAGQTSFWITIYLPRNNLATKITNLRPELSFWWFTKKFSPCQRWQLISSLTLGKINLLPNKTSSKTTMSNKTHQIALPKPSCSGSNMTFLNKHLATSKINLLQLKHYAKLPVAVKPDYHQGNYCINREKHIQHMESLIETTWINFLKRFTSTLQQKLKNPYFLLPSTSWHHLPQIYSHWVISSNPHVNHVWLTKEEHTMHLFSWSHTKIIWQGPANLNKLTGSISNSRT